MPRIIRIVFACLTLFVTLSTVNAYAWPWGEKNLVTIDGKAFTTKDFKDWWQNWREKDMPFPETAGPYIDWLLLSREAETMELYREPSFRHKVDVFLKVRALMMLKNEAIDSKIQISDRDVRREYRKKYTPLWNVQAFYFEDRDAAQKSYDDLISGALTVKELKEQIAGAEEKRPTIEERWFRPIAIINNKAWQEVLAGLKPGETAPPFAMGERFVVVHLVEKKGPDEADFDLLKEGLRRELVDARKGELNAAFFKELHKKYNVAVDQDLLEAANREDVPDELLDRPLITTNRANIPLRHFLAKYQAELNVQGKQHSAPEEKEKIRQRVLNGVLFQTLTTWESLDRHYEEKPPLASVFDFYKKHRLIKELESKVFDNMVSVGDNEIAAYYQKNLSEFTPAGKIAFAKWEGSKESAEKMKAALARGVDFFDAAMKYGQGQVPVRELPLNHLDPAVQKEIAGLVKGDVGGPFESKGRYLIIKVINRKSPRPTALDEVKPKIAKELHDRKFQSVRADYLKQLKDRSVIEVDAKAWKGLQREFGE